MSVAFPKWQNCKGKQALHWSLDKPDKPAPHFRGGQGPAPMCNGEMELKFARRKWGGVGAARDKNIDEVNKDRMKISGALRSGSKGSLLGVLAPIFFCFVL